MDWESICIVRSAATSAMSQCQTRLTETTTSTECNFGMAEIYKHVILSINRVVSSYDYVKCEVVLYCRRVHDLVGNVRNSSHPLDQRSHTPYVLMGLYDSQLLTFVGCTRRTHSFLRVSTFSCSTECGKQDSPIRPSPNGSTRMVAEVGVLWRDFTTYTSAHARTQYTHARTHTHTHERTLCRTSWAWLREYK